jgi:O-antigen/teichoic acid export membrane protein
MSAVRRADIVFSSGVRIVSAAASSLWVLIAAQLMPVDEFATFALCAALAVVFVALADLGVSTLMASSMVEEPGNGRRILFAAVKARLLAALVAVPGFLLAFSVSSDASMKPALVMCVSVVATLVHSACGMALRVIGRARFEAWADLGSRLLVLGLGAVLLDHGGGLTTAVAMYALADGLVLLAVGAAALRLLEGGDPALAGPVFRLRGFVLVAVAFSLATVYYRADLWLLGVLRDPRDVALYAAAYKVFDAVVLPSLTLAGFVVPKIGRGQDASAYRTTRRFLAISVGITIPAALGVALVAPTALDLGFGGDYRPAAGALRVLMLAAVPSAATFVVGQALAVVDPGRFAAFLGLCLVANTALNVALLPTFGYLVAAWTTLGCQLLLAAGWTWSLARKLRPSTLDEAGQRVHARFPYHSGSRRFASRSASTSESSRTLPAPSSRT